MVDKMLLLKLTCVFIAVIVPFCEARVPELDDGFLEHYKRGKWLVEFYAPWCGHCKKLEPIYEEVFKTLRNSDVAVAKIDATRFSFVASHFEVRGFPTIKFFQGEKSYTFRGERTAEDILQFVHKAKGPSVRNVASIGRFNEVLKQHDSGVFYMFVGPDDPNNDLFIKYSSIAEDQVSIAYFYAGQKRALPEAVKIQSEPTVLVFKDGKSFEYEAPRGLATMSSLNKWLNGERYSAFPLVTGSNINEMSDTGKFLVIFVIDEHDTDLKDINMRVKTIGKELAAEREKYHSHYQFLWMDDPDTANNIMLTFIMMPYILVLDPTLHLYYVPPQDLQTVDKESIAQFLIDVKAGKVEALGGTGFFMRLKRVLYDILVTVLSVWESSRWLFLIMFGLPTAVISIVCYSLCCMETIDDEVNSDDEESDEEYEQAVKGQTSWEKAIQEQQRLKDQPKDPKHPKAE